MRTFIEHMEFAMPVADHKFGGQWTEKKLERLSKYLKAFTKALKNKSFKKLYIDAFAGTGYRSSKCSPEPEVGFHELIDAEDHAETDKLAEGSARLALRTEPAFDHFFFIEAHRERFRSLEESLREDFPQLRNRMSFEKGDANVVIPRLCKEIDWCRSRAVLFLDPYGMQVDWSTVECIAATRAVDLWYLFPVAAVNRCLKRDGEIPTKWTEALDRTLGAEDWRKKFFRNSKPDLFGESSPEKVADTKLIEQYMCGRLQTVFKGGVANHALPLLNSKGSCMFLLFFACANPSPKACSLAMKFANAILKP